MKTRGWIKRSATALVVAGLFAVTMPLVAFADESDGSLNDSMDYSQNQDPVSSVDPSLDLGSSSVDWVDTSAAG